MARRVSRSTVRGVAACLVAGCLLLGTGCTASGRSLVSSPTPSGTAAIDEDVTLTLEEHDPHHGLRAVLVLEHGVTAYERYIESSAEDYWDIRSVGKSFTGTLIGIAIDAGLIRGPDATLGELLPRWADYLTPETSSIPLSAVLTHTANFLQEGTGPGWVWSAPDVVGAILTQRAGAGPGDGLFLYSSAGSHLLAAILVEASGMPVLEFARQHLFDPLGIPSTPALEQTAPFPAEDDVAQTQAYDDAEFAWPKDAQGVHMGHGLLRLRPSDLARLGQLYLDRGRWEGAQVVSEHWIDQARAPQVEVPDRRGYTDHYGFQWWVSAADGFSAAIGLGGTVIVMDAALDVVVVVASEIRAGQAPEEAMIAGNSLALATTILDEFRAT